MSLFAELKRRNVFRVGIAYAVVAWLLLQLAEVLYEILDLPPWAPRLVLLVLAIGFPLALIFAWAFEMTPEGLKREKDVDRSQSVAPVTGRKLDRTIIVVLALALGYFAVDKFVLRPAAPPPVAAEPAGDAGNAPAASASLPAAQAEDEDPMAGIDEKSIAVLPFAHRSPNPDDAYFTDGIHDDLLTALAKQDAFKVISRTSVMEYRDTTKNLRQVGQELGVRHILEGGVQRAGTRVRINVQLIDAANDEHLWAETYDRELTTDNLFDIQDEITRAIADALHATLADTPLAQRGRPPTDNLAAFELFLKAKQLSIGNTKPEWQAAVGMYEEALALDPEFALAYVYQGEAYLTLYWSYEGDPANRDAARAAIDRAIAIAPDLPELQMAEGFYHYWGHLDYPTALAHLDRAIELMPNNAEAHMWRGWASRRAGRWDEALASMRRSLELDPRATFNWLEYGQTLSYVHDLDAALEAIGRAQALGELELWSRSYTSLIYLQQGDVARAVEEAEATLRSTEPAVRTSAWEPLLLSRNFEAARAFARAWDGGLEVVRQAYRPRELLVAITHFLAGDEDVAAASARRGIERLNEDPRFIDDYRKAMALAQLHALAGDTQSALENADLMLATRPADAVEEMTDDYRLACALALAGEKARALALLEPLLPGPSWISVRYVELDPHWDGLRDDPDFIALLDAYRGKDMK